MIRVSILDDNQVWWHTLLYGPDTFHFNLKWFVQWYYATRGVGALHCKKYLRPISKTIASMLPPKML